jgi:hypothetical protein
MIGFVRSAPYNKSGTHRVKQGKFLICMAHGTWPMRPQMNEKQGTHYYKNEQPFQMNWNRYLGVLTNNCNLLLKLRQRVDFFFSTVTKSSDKHYNTLEYLCVTT